MTSGLELPPEAKHLPGEGREQISSVAKRAYGVMIAPLMNLVIPILLVWHLHSVLPLKCYFFSLPPRLNYIFLGRLTLNILT